MATTELTGRWLRQVPNALTVLRLVLVPVFIVLLFWQPTLWQWRLAAAIAFTVAILTDFFDGRLARKYNLISDFGKLWDPIADKVLTGAAFVSLSILGELPWWVTIVILVREWGVTWMRVAMLKYGVMAAQAGGKLKTFLQSVALILYLLKIGNAFMEWLGYLTMGAAFVLTVVTGLMCVREAMVLRSQATQPTKGDDDG
ncbi:MAG: CDP-diacylglycerol--glycerol-3-phosphate 3-phosphatidyltransferase [Propionibacteriaceae bacterium]|jgi:CDP-diacylglycerol--glycerol-3-phosphate 3-phosphatidyltransferase|nr:CDP-diacylglycerol--glycerol-3-phosphate 3-phosphatidyltransferase [Propionibacteriaceae bacterium]